ncbi:polyamine ABC transporter substrate-binding protein [Clostridium aestuarii]|uniref:Polyamine ABC transporter substrate-binding protein n=1 Tax=Clostridium aestuarii TaxID=338193 RepID=A0ABT4CVA2_9CLOT|nr:polyamine ABC transporter substrate-binding protein [Clostridium aestuarii]MCY6482904.1 polyamine ABC transporter substrate-binding protein [Clostridium aestuarii]
MKKKIALFLTSILVTAAFVGCGENKQAKTDKKDSSEPTELVISTWGYSEDKLWENVFKPFEKANNVKIVLETGNNSERLTKLKTNPNSNIDIVYLAEGFAQDGIKEGLFEKVDYSKIPNAEKITEKAKYLINQGYGPAYTLNRAAIAYDPSKVDGEIKSWNDLWNASLKGKVSIPDITTTFGPSVVYTAAAKAGADVKGDNGEAAFKELEALKPNLVKTYKRSSDLANMFSSGEITAAVIADFAYPKVVESSPNVKFIDPEEGAYLNFNTINVVKSSKNKELALKFINYALSEEVQTRTAKALGESPVNVEVKLSEEESKNLTYGESLEKSNVIDYKFVNSVRTSWIDKWNRILNQ